MDEECYANFGRCKHAKYSLRKNSQFQIFRVQETGTGDSCEQENGFCKPTDNDRISGPAVQIHIKYWLRKQFGKNF